MLNTSLTEPVIGKGGNINTSETTIDELMRLSLLSARSTKIPMFVVENAIDMHADLSTPFRRLVKDREIMAHIKKTYYSGLILIACASTLHSKINFQEFIDLFDPDCRACEFEEFDQLLQVAFDKMGASDLYNGTIILDAETVKSRYEIIRKKLTNKN